MASTLSVPVRICYEWSLKALLALIIGTSLGIEPVYLISSLVVFVVSCVWKGDLLVSEYALTPIILFVLGLVFTVRVLLMGADAHDSNDQITIIFRSRKFVIEFMVGLLVYFSLKRYSIYSLLEIFVLAFIVNIVAALIQLGVLGGRVSMLFFEPSSAAYFICSFFFLIYGLSKGVFYARFVSIGFFMATLLVASKAQVLLYLIYPLIRSFRLRSVALYLVCITVPASLLFYFYLHDYMYEKFLQYRGFSIFLNVLVDSGIAGLSADNDVFNTYVTRISSITVAVEMLFSEFLGKGFGYFGVEFLSVISDQILYSQTAGEEVSKILVGDVIASPKSKLLEVLISTGWLGVVVIAIASVRIFRNLSFEKFGLKASWIMFLMASLIVELNNFYLYAFVFASFSEKMAKECVK